MPFGRIQKLLCDEYCQFGDTVLIESPFAETTRDGEGRRQVHMGITPTKLIIASDYLDPLLSSSVIWYGQDPEVETLELLSLYPVEYVNLSVFTLRRRQSLKATFANNVTRYFELGGLEKRKMFWNLWCERVLDLNPDAEQSPRSSTHSILADRPHSRRTRLAWKSSCDSVTQRYRDAGIIQYGELRRKKWVNKYINLGSKRDREDRVRPTPAKAMTLDPCPETRPLGLRDPPSAAPCCLQDCKQHTCWRLQDLGGCGYEEYTYAGVATSNVTYTSILSKAYAAGDKSR